MSKESHEQIQEQSNEQKIIELQEKLDKQVEELHGLNDEINKTFRELKKVKLDSVKPTTEVQRLAAQATPMDDVFFNKISENKEAIQEIIATILGVQVEVKSTTPQFAILNIGSRGVRLDDFSEIIVTVELLEDCEWGNKGAFVDVEVQNQDNVDHEFRVYYNGASMIINKTPANTDFKDLPHAIVIYISSFDVFGEGKMFYEVIKTDKESGKHRRSPVSEFYDAIT